MQSPTWTHTFGIDSAEHRHRLFFSPEETHEAPFGNAMAQGIEAGVTGYLAYQGKPLIAFVYAENEKATPDTDQLRNIWKSLWNQGLASVLVFHRPQKVEIYSLTPMADDAAKDFLTPVEALELAKMGLEAFSNHCRDLVWKLEDGQYYEEHQERFVAKNRADSKLLSNMEVASGELTKLGLSPSQARALLLQTLFIAYLEDRGILQEADFRAATGFASLSDILEKNDIEAFLSLFQDLSGKFNGDVFSSPCHFGGLVCNDSPKAGLISGHLSILLEFRKGRMDSRKAQYSLLPLYDFKFIPVELLSAIYDKFQNPETKRDTGSYFTPAYLAQACLDIVWKYLSQERATSPDFKILDPACGSAVFLVCAFQRLVGMALARFGSVSWDKLREILHRLHGIDQNEDALRVGIISLYIALLERSDPPSISELKAKGHLLPRLMGNTMRVGDFFDDAQGDSQTFDLVLGNPPWISRNKSVTGKMKSWCESNKCLMPANSSVWGFLWKAGRMLRKDGVAALLVDAKIFFNLQAENARRQFFVEFRIPLLVNFADACFQLFEGAAAPAALCVLQPWQEDKDWQKADTEYWSPKANPVFSANHRIALSPDDLAVVKQWRLEQDTSVLKRRRWGRSRDISLLQELKRFPLLAERMAEYKQWSQKYRPDKPWLIGQGFTLSSNANTSDAKSVPHLQDAQFVTTEDIESSHWMLRPLKRSWQGTTDLYRAGIIAPIIETCEFTPPLILINQGVSRSTGQMQACYTEQRLAFRDSIQAIVSSCGINDASTFKILTAVLNSRLATWFFFHTSAMQAVERAKVLQKDILALPFPLPEECDDSLAGKQIVATLDAVASQIQTYDDDDNSQLQNPFMLGNEWDDKINDLVYRYYGLTKNERQVVEDTFRFIIPSMQPRKDSHPILWERPDNSILNEYAKFLREGLSSNYQQGTKISVKVYGGSQCLALAELTLGGAGDARGEIADSELLCRLEALKEIWPGMIANGVHQLIQFIFARGNNIYLIKPNRIRHWMPSAALCDVDRIVADLNIAKLEKRLQ